MERNGGNVIIIKRKTVVEGGHHGGAWKVAYADFVTAMMAFFLLMWLLSVSDEETRLGLADYFSPTIPIHSTVGGGDGPFNGDSMFSQDVLARDETGRKTDEKRDEIAGAEAGALDQTLLEVQAQLTGSSGDAVKADPALAHIRTRVTDEGLIIEVFDIDGSPLFDGATATPNPIYDRLVAMIGRVLSRTSNPIAVSGHLATGDTKNTKADAWTLSTDRAQLTRARLEDAGVTDARINRVTGRADREPSAEGAADPRSRRVEITLLRRFPSGDAENAAKP